MPLTTVTDVAQMLRWGQAGGGELEKFGMQLLAYVAAASQVVEAEAGPFEARTIVHVSDGGPSLLLPTRVTTVTDVVVSGVTVSDWTLNAAAGIIYGPFTPGRQNVTVTYTAGFEVVPEAAKLAATMVAADMWAIASQRAPGVDDGSADPSYLMPKVIRRLLEPFMSTRMPGFA